MDEDQLACHHRYSAVIAEHGLCLCACLLVGLETGFVMCSLPGKGWSKVSFSHRGEGNESSTSWEWNKLYPLDWFNCLHPLNNLREMKYVKV